MSTLQAINLKHPSSASNNVVLDSSGNASFAGTVVPSSSFLRNRIINGGMEVAQRATTATGAYTSVFVYASVDRWAVYSANSSTTQAQSTDAPAGFRNSFRLQRPAGNTGTGVLLLGQAIEAVNCYDLSGQSVTVSFWAKRGANYSGGNLALSAVTGTTADQGLGSSGSWAGRQTPINTSFAITTTWTRYTATGTFGAGVLEASVEFNWAGSGTAGADDSVYITGVQLEVGTAATPFERRLYGQELALCQRYYQKSYEQNTVPGASTRLGLVMAFASSGGVNWGGGFNLRQTMRAAPSISYWDGVGNASRVSYYAGAWNDNNNWLTLLNISSDAVVTTASVQVTASVLIQYAASAEL